MIAFLIHDDSDTVGVAVRDIKSSESVQGRSLHGKAAPEVQARADIPLGHKIALKTHASGDTVIKYGCDIGRAVADIGVGDHVHVHNVKTKRW